MKKENKIEIIEQYLLNQLTLAEKRAFEIRAQLDPAIGQELEKRRVAHEAIDYMISCSVKSELVQIDQHRHASIFTIKRRPSVYALAIAASVLILIGAFFATTWLSPSEDSTVMAYYEQPDFSWRSSPANVFPSALMQGMQALESKSYSSAILSFEQVDPAEVTYSLAQYLLGHTYFLSGKYKAATTTFLRVIEIGDIRYKEEAEWNALVSCLLAGLDCSDRFETILKTPNHTYFQKVKNLENQTTK